MHTFTRGMKSVPFLIVVIWLDVDRGEDPFNHVISGSPTPRQGRETDCSNLGRRRAGNEEILAGAEKLQQEIPIGEKRE